MTGIVGIGASAGGLVALEQFLHAVPPHSDLAYIVVQHLDPTQKALLPELLQRVTAMSVCEAGQDMPIAADCVYVIPPNTELSVSNDTLKLSRPREPRGMRLPIDVLFSSLASARGDRAIAVILSGMGADGTLGMQAIKAVGGLTLAQDPSTAQFDAMPCSAIAAGCADIVAAPDALPGRILRYVARFADRAPTLATAPAHDAIGGPLEHIVGLLRQHSRHDFSHHKTSTLLRRIERRMAIHGLSSLTQYAAFLERSAQEIELLFKELLIGVTSFFRDPAVWDYLAEVALPELLARHPANEPMRVWSVGCSTGEEAYSLAMIFAEAVQRPARPTLASLQIFASDLSPDAIAFARRGQYPATIAPSVGTRRLARFFTTVDGGYQVKRDLRDQVLFAEHDAILDPPFTRLDLIACRNVLIYLDSALQRRLLPLFHYSLRAGGLLLLGSSETVGRQSQLFAPVDSKRRLYRRQDQVVTGDSDFMVQSFPPLTAPAKESPMSSAEGPPALPDTLQSAADHVLLQVYAPAAVVLNAAGDIVYISGRTGKYLEPAAGKANWNFHAMIRDELRAPIADALQKATAQREPVQLDGLDVTWSGRVQRVNVTVQALHQPAVLDGMTIVVFRDIAPAPDGRRQRKSKSALNAAHALEIQRYSDEIQALRDETRASREELQAANEELQSTNEELQSANEELTTSKEEMQSMNEELQTINAELQTKLDDLALAQSDMKNVLNSIEIAILFLDKDLNVRRYTDRAAKIINLRDSDLGRPLSDLTSSLQYPTLHEDAVETLRTLKFSETQVLANDQRWFTVRIMPYRRLDNLIDGVVITFVDITATKNLESTLREQARPTPD